MISDRDGPGIRLARRFYQQRIGPRLAGRPHAAALLGAGSEVLGFDDEVSPDHGFGPRVQLFVPDADTDPVRRLFDDLDGTFDGVPIRYPRYDGEPPRHQVEVHTAAGYFTNWLGTDPARGLRVTDWLLTPTQVLGTLTAGAVFSDPDRALAERRRALDWYPDDVWRYVLAATWLRIGQEEPFVGRAGARGDDLGSRVVAARLARDMMRLAMLIERHYPPYSKWLGTAFARLDIAAELHGHLDRALAAAQWREREAALGAAGHVLGIATNALGLAAPVDPAPRQFHSRDIRVPGGERYAAALCAAIADPSVRAVLARNGYRHGGEVPSLPGAIDQAVDSTDVLGEASRCRSAAAMLGTVAR